MTTKNDYYWDKKNWEINQSGRGIRVHPLVALILAPIVGALFVVFLPFIGLYMFGKHVAAWAGSAAGSLIRTSIGPVAVPGEAHLTGAKAKESRAGEETLRDLAEEIQARRDK